MILIDVSKMGEGPVKSLLTFGYLSAIPHSFAPVAGV